MASFERKTIRDALLGMVSDHLYNGGIACVHPYRIGCELVGLLAAYREEDRRLYPEVYLLGDAHQKLLSMISPGAVSFVTGNAQINANEAMISRTVASAALKSRAALAIDGWAIFISRETEGFAFGLFRSLAAPYSAGSEQVLLEAIDQPVALFRNSAANAVEIINKHGDGLEVSLTTASPAPFSSHRPIAEFCKAACGKIDEPFRVSVTQYAIRVLTDALRASHGALLAISDQSSLPEELEGVVLDQPIPWATTAAEAIRDKNAEAADRLRSYESLLHGMIMSDGVTILGADGSIRAFRVFVRHDAKAASSSSGPAIGGTRSRAFEALSRWVDSS